MYKRLKKKADRKDELAVASQLWVSRNRVKTRWPGAVAGETQKGRGREYKLVPVSSYSLRLVD